MKNKQINELLYEALETEMGGIRVYETALRAAANRDLREEWEKYLDQTRNHERILREVFAKLDIDPDGETAGRTVVRHIGESLVAAIEMAIEAGTAEDAELVAAESVVEAETKDHLNWELLGEVARKMRGSEAQALKQAVEEVESEEDEHLYHTTGWARELWMASLGLQAVLPPPEEKKDVKTAIGAARAKQQRKKLAG